jgi:hypothetical protein
MIQQPGKYQNSSHSKLRNARSGRANPRAPEIVISIVLGFSVTLGITLWQRNTKRPATREPETTGTAFIGGSPAASPSERPMMLGSIRVEQPKRIAQAAANPSPASVPPMPVRFILNRSVVPNGSDKRHMSIAVESATIRNLSDESMDIAVYVLTAATHSTSQQIHVNVGPNGEKRIGKEDGLEMRSGDRITLQSPPYPDSVTTLP